ncbi:helix-turn-helix domain-containing protein [Flavobacterium soli]|uniref:helix-turn-helix domain-containing protein n=1 Tax=Flavobacterium soli TaxID=344881 RepID=UPI0003FC8C3D|nr:helix-turn-helix domain-containing protein [Flavobacterium soli]
MTVNITPVFQSISAMLINTDLNALGGFLRKVDFFTNILFKVAEEIPEDTYKHVSGADPITCSFPEHFQCIAAAVLLENSKFYFLLIYVSLIVLSVILLERINYKKKSRIHSLIDDPNAEFGMEHQLSNGENIDPLAEECEKKLMSNEVKEELLKKLIHFEEGTKYTDKSLNLSALAVKLKTNTKYLSYVINKYKKKDFNSYINELRIHYIIRKMESNHAYLNYKISYLANECGFSSHSKFTAVFKSIVGMSPSCFMEQLSKRKNENPSTSS